METKRPWQIWALAISYLIGIAYIINFTSYQTDGEKRFINYCVAGVSIFIFAGLITALFIRRPWAYNVSIALLLLVCIGSVINLLFLFFMPSIWLIIIPISGLFTIYAILCSDTRIYFGVKKEKFNTNR